MYDRSMLSVQQEKQELDAENLLCARLFTDLRSGTPSADDLVALACCLLDCGRHDSPAVIEVMERRPSSLSPAELRSLASELLRTADFDPGFEHAPERLELLREALAIAARDLPPGWATGGAHMLLYTDSAPVPQRVMARLADGWIHGNGLYAGEGDDLTAALAGWAEHLQESVTERNWTVWPLCPEHGIGLHGAEHDGLAVWRCSAGPEPTGPGSVGHSVAPVGELRARISS